MTEFKYLGVTMDRGNKEETAIQIGFAAAEGGDLKNLVNTSRPIWSKIMKTKVYKSLNLISTILFI